MDLSNLEEWEDIDLMQALNEIAFGLSENSITWIERFNKGMEERNCLSGRQREVAEDILRGWNEQHGD